MPILGLSHDQKVEIFSKLPGVAGDTAGVKDLAFPV